MTTSPSPVAAWLGACVPAETEGLYFIGTFDPRITFFSQQVRALRLARAMVELDIVAPDATVAVVGAGAAGVTVALALALAGKKVTLYDPATEILHLQSASQRLLHPHIYEWPELGSLDNQAGLPLLDWSSSNGGAVCGHLKHEFAMARAKLPDLQTKHSHKLTLLERVDPDWRLTFTHGGAEPSRRYKHVILAMGFGEERSCGDAKPADYWKPSGVGTAANEAEAGATYLVSGNGDGGLTELLGLLIADFEHVSFTREFLASAPGSALHAAAQAVFAGKPYEADIEDELETSLRPILDEHGVLDRLRIRLRTDRQVTFNSRSALFAAGRAAQLNQCMAYAVLEAAKLEGRPVTRTLGEVTDVAEVPGGMTVTGIKGPAGAVTASFSHVILRHGPVREDRYQVASTPLSAYKARIEAERAATAGQIETPVLDEATYDFFRTLWIEKLADLASREALKQQSVRDGAMIAIGLDSVAQSVVERGSRSLGQLAEECERLPVPVIVQIDVGPSQLPDAVGLLRLTRASAGRIELRASANVFDAWRALHPAMAAASVALPRFRPRQIDTSTIPPAIDGCLMRLLNARVDDAVANGGCPPIGKINTDMLAHVTESWHDWRAALDADPMLRFDFLRWLATVDQDQARPWDGDHGHLSRMGNALIMMLATHHGEPLVPARNDRGNLAFAADAVALGSGCEAIGIHSIAIWHHPDQWGVDALILSGTGDLVVNDPGTVMDGGAPGTGMKTARRVRPAVIQKSPFWCEKLGAGLQAWKTAVTKEFAELRERQDNALEEISQ